MLKIKFTADYRKDRKRMKKRGADLNLLDQAIKILQEEIPLPASYQDHPLKNTVPTQRDLHIKPDWLLIYRIDKATDTLILFRTGTHSDIF